MKKKALVFLILLSNPVDSFAENLRDVIQKGLNYNLDNKIAETEREISVYKRNQTESSYWPTFDLSAKTRTINRGDADNYIRDEDEDAMLDLNLRYTILDFARDSEYEAAKLSIAGRELNKKIQ
ncbi:hypothetical protein BXD50_005286, partial [Salmonella enterica subsp. enterica]|nr:hypothetical protein [Salmonella enterica subsp. enterica serovar Overschie]EDN4789420.1 hypothetical protein [Salmonella enterica subsp. enterica]